MPPDAAGRKAATLYASLARAPGPQERPCAVDVAVLGEEAAPPQPV